MKKLIGLLLITMLVFSVTGCNVGLSSKHGFGELIINGANITREDANPITENTTVKIGKEEKILGETFILKTGTYDAYIKDGKFAETVKVEVVLGKQTVKPKVLLKELLFNAIKLVFDPATFGGKTVENPEQINEVYVKGNITHPDWGRLDALTENEDGTWSVIVPAVTDENLEFGFAYWLDTDGDGVSDTPADESGEWAGGNPGGGNYTVATGKADGIVSDVIGMKMIYNPATFGGEENADKPADPAQITKVKVKGSITDPEWGRLDNLTKNEDETWSVIVPAVDEGEFGFEYCLDTDGDGIDDVIGKWAGGNPDGGNYTVATGITAGIIIKDF